MRMSFPQVKVPPPLKIARFCTTGIYRHGTLIFYTWFTVVLDEFEENLATKNNLPSLDNVDSYKALKALLS